MNCKFAYYVLDILVTLAIESSRFPRLITRRDFGRRKHMLSWLAFSRLDQEGETR